MDANGWSNGWEGGGECRWMFGFINRWYMDGWKGWPSPAPPPPPGRAWDPPSPPLRSHRVLFLCQECHCAMAGARWSCRIRVWLLGPFSLLHPGLSPLSSPSASPFGRALRPPCRLVLRTRPAVRERLGEGGKWGEWMSWPSVGIKFLRLRLLSPQGCYCKFRLARSSVALHPWAQADILGIWPLSPCVRPSVRPTFATRPFFRVCCVALSCIALRWIALLRPLSITPSPSPLRQLPHLLRAPSSSLY